MIPEGASPTLDQPYDRAHDLLCVDLHISTSGVFSVFLGAVFRVYRVLSSCAIASYDHVSFKGFIEGASEVLQGL